MPVRRAQKPDGFNAFVRMKQLAIKSRLSKFQVEEASSASALKPAFCFIKELLGC